MGLQADTRVRIHLQAGSAKYRGVNLLHEGLDQARIPDRDEAFEGMGHSWRDPWL